MHSLFFTVDEEEQPVLSMQELKTEDSFPKGGWQIFNSKSELVGSE